MHKLSVIIPALNEENGIADIIERVLAIEGPLTEVGVSALELIIVDDGSQDRTAEIVSRYPAVRLVRHATNRGYGAAIKTGFRRAEGDLLAFLDADGTYHLGADLLVTPPKDEALATNHGDDYLCLLSFNEF